jgi:hypothetical protein
LPGEQYYGVSGTTSIYNPKTSIAQASLSHVYIQSSDGTNKIFVGWQVSFNLSQTLYTCTK